MIILKLFFFQHIKTDMEIEKKFHYGTHVGGSGSLIDVLKAAKAKGKTIVQIFLGSPMSLNRRKLTKEEVIETKRFLRENEMEIVSHFPYVFNMGVAGADIGTLQTEINTMVSIGGRVVVHTGSATFGSISNRNVNDRNRDEWTKQWKIGCDYLIGHLEKLDFSLAKDYGVDYPLLLEPPAGEGKKLLCTFEQIKYVFDSCPKEVGFCLDTCHFFGAGKCRFDTKESIVELFQKLEDSIGGLQKLKLIHFNDSKNPFGSMKDDHEDIAKGFIWKDTGLDALIDFWKFCRDNNVDIIAEIGSEHNMKVMKMLDKIAKKK